MRILLVHHGWPPESQGGSELYTAALARQLVLDHEVAALHPAAEASRPDGHLAETRRDGVRVFALNNLHRADAGFEAYRDPEVGRIGGRLVEQWRPDLVHVGHLSGLSTGLVFEARQRGVPVVLTLHDFWPLCPLGQLLNVRLRVCPGPTPRRCLSCVGGQLVARSAATRALGRRFLPAAGAVRWLARLVGRGRPRIERRLEEMREVLRAADALVSPSRFVRDRLASLGVQGVEVVPNGHDPLPAFAHRPDPLGRVRFGFLGAAIPSKGVDVLARAYRILDQPRACLKIHGPFLPYHGELRYEAQVRGILGPHADDSLRGPFAPSELGQVLAGLDVIVVPSIWEENAPLVVQEAFQARLPLVVSDHGGLAESVREGIDGLRFRPGDPEHLARTMRRLVEEPGLLKRLGSDPPPVPTMAEHVRRIEGVYERARRRFRERAGRLGAVVLDCGRPEDAARAARSTLDPALPVRVVVVENGTAGGQPPPEGIELLRLDGNRGYAGGMNAGLARLRESGCDRVVLLNNDARLDPGCLRRLAEALEDPGVAAAGPVVLREGDGRIESRGVRLGLWLARQRLIDHGRPYLAREGHSAADALSGAALMLSMAALDRVGVLAEDYFHSFEDLDWCVRARQAGLRLVVVQGALARHAGGATLDPRSAEALYYGVRNHLRAAERLMPLGRATRWLRRLAIVSLSLGQAFFGAGGPRVERLRSVFAGTADFLAGRFGARRSE